MRGLRAMADSAESCAHVGGARRFSDLRPFYFRWDDGRLEQLAPAGVALPVNQFWRDFFGRNPAGVDSAANGSRPSDAELVEAARAGDSRAADR